MRKQHGDKAAQLAGAKDNDSGLDKDHHIAPGCHCVDQRGNDFAVPPQEQISRSSNNVSTKMDMELAEVFRWI